LNSQPSKKDPCKTVPLLTYKNCDYNKDSKLLRNKASLLDLFPKRKAKRRLARWRPIATADRSKNKPAEKRRSDRPSKYKIKIKYITLIFKLYSTGYQCQLHHRRGGRSFAMCESKGQPPAKARFRVIHETSHFYLNIKILNKCLIAEILAE